MKIIFVFLLVALAMRAEGNSLKCYVCDGDECDNESTIKAKICGPEETTAIPTTPTTEATTDETDTTNSNTGTTSSSTETVPTATGSTSSTEPTTESAPTVAPGGPTATPSESTALPSESTEAPAESSSTAVSTENTPTAASSASTEAQTTIPPSEPTGGQTEGAPTAAPTASTAAPTASTETNTDKKLRQKRSVSASSVLINNYRQMSRTRRDSGELSYSCYSVEYKDGDKVKKQKGCVAIPTEKSACEVVADKVDNIVENSCKPCVGNLCNSSSMIRLSILTLLIALFAKVLM